METTTSQVPQLAPEQIVRAADYLELVWRYQDGEQERATLTVFPRRRPGAGVLVGEFGELLLADYISVMPDGHTDCESGYSSGSWWPWRAGTSSAGAWPVAERRPRGSRRGS